ncbi:hypothetical protein AB1Y20_022804 [Prymnesium parvum]|uniref:Uncharacterized protein n=1 Tax=Prymnesium parvum TaxID=97485 RepID=A0AB34JC69_PRYPA
MHFAHSSLLARPASVPSPLLHVLASPRYDIGTVCVDSKVGGYSHDLADPAVADELRALAASPHCLGVLMSTPCNTFSAAPFRDDEAPVLRDLEHPAGVPGPDGSLPVSVLRANAVTDNALSVAAVAARRGAGVLIESPVPRSTGPHAIPGRERHASLWEYPAVVDAETCVHRAQDWQRAAHVSPRCLAGSQYPSCAAADEASRGGGGDGEGVARRHDVTHAGAERFGFAQIEAGARRAALVEAPLPIMRGRQCGARRRLSSRREGVAWAREK